MGFSIAEMLSGNIVQPRQAPQDNSSAGLGQMLSFLMNSNQQPVAQVPESKYPSLSELASISAGRRKEKQQADATEQMRQLIGTRPVMGVDSADPVLANGLPGTGYLGGKTSEGDLYANMMTSADENIARNGAQLFSDYKKPLASPAVHSMGAPGRPGYKVNFILGPNNTAIPVGEPYRESSGININTGNAGQNLLTKEQKIEYGIPEKDVAQVNQTGGINIVKSAPLPVELKDWQRKDLDFLQRMEQADKVLTKIGTDYNPIYVKATRYVEDTPIIGDIANASISSNDQQVLQAQRQLLNSVLRPESGAVISETDYKSGEKQYFPQPNDSKEVLIQKANARRIAINGLKLGIPQEFLPKSDMESESYSPSSTGGTLKSHTQYLQENK